MNLLVDMNLSPDWVEALRQRGHSAVHWSTVGDSRAADEVVLEWARAHAHVVFTHDLDFARLLALTGARGPSVLQVRAQDVMPATLAPIVAEVLRQHGVALEAGAVVSVDEDSARARILPLRPEP